MPITAQDIVTRVRDATLDNTTGGIRWVDDELIRYINDASQAIVQAKPSSHPTNSEMQLKTGTTQEAPSDAIFILDVIRNVDGKAVRYVERGVLDAGHPDWHTMDPQPEIRHYMMEEHDPRHFYVYPPSDGTGKVQIVYSSEPAQISSLPDELPLSSTYINSYVDYVLYRAYSKDADFAANRELATWYYQSFAQGLGIRLDMEMGAPRRKDPHTPSPSPRV